MNPELIYKYLENTATDDEMKQVLDWLDADPAHVRELDELDKVMAASVIYGPDVLSPAPAKKAARRISLGRIPLRRIVRYAAELAAVAVVGIGVARMLADDRIEEWTRRTTALEVPAGQYLSMELQDGTKVWLNAGTRLEYPLVFAGGERRVKVAGEAMFDVEHDPAHPFVVETFACDVEVLGTKFDVMAEEREAVEAGDMQQGAALADEQDAFLTEHVLPWLAPWRYAVEKYARTDYYRGVGAFVFGLIACYAERFGIRFDGKASAFKRRK